MKNKKDTNALLIGLGLIIVVILITFFRSNYFSTKNEASPDQTADQTETATGQKYQTIASLDLQKKLTTGNKINLLDIRSFDDYINHNNGCN